MSDPLLVDTNVILDLYHRRFSPEQEAKIKEILEGEQYAISVVNKIELLGYPELLPDEIAFLTKVIGKATIIPLSDEIAEKAIELKQVKRIKLPDAIIAATAIIYGAKVLTRNTKDFENLPGLTYIDPHEH